MKLNIKNFAAVNSAEINFNGLTVIAGENDSGKSTVGKLIFSIVKAVSRFEQDLEEDREKKIFKLIEKNYFEIKILLPFFQKKLEVIEKLNIFQPNLFYKEVEPFIKNTRKEGIDIVFHTKVSCIEDLIKNKDIKKVFKVHLRKILQNLNDLKTEIKKQENKSDILKRAFKRVLTSEFKMEITPKTTTRKTKVSWSESEVELFKLNLDNNKITDFDLYDDRLVFDDVTFIENPIILQFFEMIENADTLFDIANTEDKNERIARFGKPKVSLHIKDLMNKLKNAQYFFDDEQDDNYQIALNIQKIINGNFDFSGGDSDFLFSKKVSKDKSFNLKSINTASGIKAFGIIQLLLLTGIIDNKSLLVIDEPETHLHPKWQVAYVQILVELVKNDINVLITSHSPYLIQAIKYYTMKEGINDKVNFYLSEKHDALSNNIKDVTNDLNQIFMKLSEPLQKLVWQK